jgi:hopanoid biosynthesis associated RND transporter like protein HpnN
MNKPTNETLFGRLLAGIAALIHRHPRWFIWPQFVLVLMSVAYTVNSLQFNTRRDELVGANQRYHHNFLSLKKEFPAQFDLVVVVESGDAEANRQFIERLGAKVEAERVRIPVSEPAKKADKHRLLGLLKRAISRDAAPVVTMETNLFVNVFYKGDLKALGPKALLFLTDEELQALEKTLLEYRPFINRFTQATNLVSLFDIVNKSILTARRETNADNASLVRMLPALGRIIRQADAALARPGRPPSPGVNAFFNSSAEAEEKIYVTFDEGRLYLLTAQAPIASLNGPAASRLEELIEETRNEVPGVNVGLTGEPVLDAAELLQSQKDTSLASVVSLILCALIFIYGYHETGRPIKATVCLLAGLAYTMAFATLAVGHLNILTITFAPMLIGLAIDFGVHLVTRYEEELRHGRSQTESLTKAMVYTGKGIFTGAFTTAAGFLAMMFTDFKGIKEMGLICGGGLLVSLVPMMTMPPALLLVGRQNMLDQEQREPVHRAWLERLWLARPKITIGITMVLCLLAFWPARTVTFDYNLLNMQSQSLPAVQVEHKLISKSPKSVIYASIVATNLEHAVQLEGRITNLSSVASVDSLAKYLYAEPGQRLAHIREIKSVLAGVSFSPADSKPVDVLALSRTLYYFGGYLGAAASHIGGSEPALAAQMMELKSLVTELRRSLIAHWDRAPGQCAEHLAIYQRALFEDVRGAFATLQAQDDQGRLEAHDLPPALRSRFIGINGKYQLLVYPRKDIWQRENQAEFIGQLRKIDPDVTGTPVQMYEYTELLRQSYIEAAWYSLIAISLMVLIHFRSLLMLMLALLPVVIGTLWMVGLMGWAGVPFNPANIMTLPLVIGIGVTNGIHILNRFAEEADPRLFTKSTGKAVFVSALTTIAGFGSLILARHQGIQSLGYVMATGTAACAVAGLTFLPALLCSERFVRWQKRKQPSALTK